MTIARAVQPRGRGTTLKIGAAFALAAAVVAAMLLAAAQAQALSAGCTTLNDPLYDGPYGNFGITNTFLAGERLTISASSPSAGATQFQLNHDGFAGSPVAIPGSIVYTFPSSGTSSLAWFTVPFGNAVWDVSCSQPLVATFRGVTATTTGHGVLVRWRTASEVGVLAFNVYRVVLGKRVRVNTRVIRAHGPAAYSFLDRKPPQARLLRYWIQLVNLDGSRSWYGPVLTAGARGTEIPGL